MKLIQKPRMVQRVEEEDAVDREEVDQRREQRQRDLEEDEVREAAAADRMLARTPERRAVLPHGLQRPVAPAVALPPEAAERRRRLGPGARVLLVDDAPAGASDRERQVGVLGERRAGDAAHVDEHLAPERSDRAGHGRHALQDVVEPAVEVEAHHVLDVLPAAEQPAAVADLRVARDGADVRLAEGLDELAQACRARRRCPRRP